MNLLNNHHTIKIKSNTYFVQMKKTSHEICINTVPKNGFIKSPLQVAMMLDI